MKAVRAVAWVEGAKGIVAIVAATGLAAASHADAGALVARIAEHLHLNPASKYPAILLHAASQHEARLMWLALGALAYATVRLIEAYGLFLERTWAQGLAAVSGAIYIPAEIYALVREPNGLALGLLVLNVVVVAVMVDALRRRQAVGHQAGADMAESGPPTTGGR